MKIRLRRLTSEEAEQAAYDGWPLVIPICRANHHLEEVEYAVLEEIDGEDSAEGPSWKLVDIT